MATIRIRYLVKKKREDGSFRFYWQPSAELRKAGWKNTRLSNNEHAAQAEAQTLNTKVDDWYQGEGSPQQSKAGSIDALIDLYKKSDNFKKLRNKTKDGYEQNLKILSRLIGDQAIRSIKRSNASSLYEKLAHDQYDKKKLIRKGTPATAAAVIRVARLLFKFAWDKDMVEKNPFEKPGISSKARKAKIWTPEHVRLFAEMADEKGFFSIGTAVILNEWIGQRRGDIQTLSETQYKDGRLHISQSKTGKEVFPPIDKIPHLKLRLEEQIRRNRQHFEQDKKRNKVHCLTIIQNQDGKPYTMDGFATLFNRIRTACANKYPGLEFEELTFQTLRHTAVTRLGRIRGMTAANISAISGHELDRCQSILKIYNVRTTEAADDAFDMALEYEESRK